MRGLMMASLVLVLGGCGGGDIAQVRKAVADQLKDPDSARFKNERVIASNGICGEVNARNVHGAYSGFFPFFAIKTPTGFDVALDPSFSDRFSSNACGYTLAKKIITNPQQINEIPGVRWIVLAASLSSEQTAERLFRELSDLGWQPSVRRADGESQVLLGPFETRAKAQAMVDTLANKKISRGIVLQYQKPEK